ncbi:MAG: hypothetical protein WA114_06820, partial [Psychrobacter glacincola]
LEYLQAVIIEDSLGIADELEAQMQMLVDNYVCEWAATINDTEKLKRFRHFVNSEQGDENVIFVTERDQIRPATDAEKTTIKLVELA